MAFNFYDGARVDASYILMGRLSLSNGRFKFKIWRKWSLILEESTERPHFNKENRKISTCNRLDFGNIWISTDCAENLQFKFNQWQLEWRRRLRLHFPNTPNRGSQSFGGAK